MADLLDHQEVAFLLYEFLNTEALLERSRYVEHSRELFDATVDLFTRVAATSYAPYYQKGDACEPTFDGTRVHLIDETKMAWDVLRETGFLKAHCDFAEGGLQLPEVILRMSMGQLMVANGPATAYPFLTLGVINLLRSFGSEKQKTLFLPRLMDGEFSGTMALTEPSQGSTLSDIHTRAEPQADGSYRIFGQKMFISGGEHSLTDNIIHMVLARVPGEPVGTRGISLFLVPRRLVNERGEVGERNDVALAGLLHKMGQRNSTTTILNFGERDGAVGYLVGGLGQGLACMFQMMNEARIGVGLNAAATAYAGFRYALDYARTRKQGRLPSNKDPASRQVPLIAHADVRRMLLAQKAYAEGGLALCLYASSLFEDERTHPEPERRSQAGALLSLLTPIVKSWSAHYGCVANDLAIQVLGGAGFTRDHPVEQLLRDQRINPIHEGTEGIHALSLLARQVRIDDGAALRQLRREINKTVAEAGDLHELTECAALLAEHADLLELTTATLIEAIENDPDRGLANATAYLDVFGRVVVGWIWLRQAVIAARALPEATGEKADFYRGKLQAADWYLRWEVPLIAPVCARLRSNDSVCFEMQDSWF